MFSSLSLLKNLLELRLQTLQADVDQSQDLRLHCAGDALAEVCDRKDVAARVSEAAVDEAQAARDFGEIAQIRAALRRIELGSYGQCADCGETVPIERLIVEPFATRCVACQYARERRP